SLLAYGPLAGGKLSGKYMGGAKPQGARFTLFPSFGSRYAKPHVDEAVAAYHELARSRGLSLVQLAHGYVMSRWFVGASIIGATSTAQLAESIDATETVLDAETLAGIEEIQRLYPNPPASGHAAGNPHRATHPAHPDPLRLVGPRPGRDRRDRRGQPRAPAAHARPLAAFRAPARCPARRAPSPSARAARADLREVRPGALHPARPPAARHRRRARAPAGPRAPLPRGAGGRPDRAQPRAAAGVDLRGVRPHARRLGIHCPGALRPAARRARGRREGPAPRHGGRDRARPGADAPRRLAAAPDLGRRPAPASAG